MDRAGQVAIHFRKILENHPVFTVVTLSSRLGCAQQLDFESALKGHGEPVRRLVLVFI